MKKIVKILLTLSICFGNIGIVFANTSSQTDTKEKIEAPSISASSEVQTNTESDKENLPKDFPQKEVAPSSKGAQNKTTDYASQFFTEVSFTDLAGNPLASVQSTDKIKVNYSFNIPGGMHEKDTMSIQLPPQLKLVNYSDFPLIDSQGETIANVTTDKTTGLMTMTFTSAVEGKLNLKGESYFWAKFDKTQISEGPNNIPMPLALSTTTLSLDIKIPVGSGSSRVTNPTVIFKSGSVNTQDPTLIDWTITINNANQNLYLPNVVDEIGAGQTLVLGTFDFNYRDANKKSMKKFSLVAGQIENGGRTIVNLSGNGFSVDLDSLGSYNSGTNFYSVVINYQTKIAPQTTSCVNVASSIDEKNQPQSRQSTVNIYGNGGNISATIPTALDTLSNTIDTAQSIDATELPASSASQLSKGITSAQNTIDTETSTLNDINNANAALSKVIQEATPEIKPPTRIGGDITINYLDEHGKGIPNISPQTISGNIGDNYDASTDNYKIKIDGYTLDEKKLPENSTGTFTYQAQRVNYIYIKNKLMTPPSSEDSSSHSTTQNIKQELPKTGTNNGNSEVLYGLLLLFNISIYISFRFLKRQ